MSGERQMTRHCHTQAAYTFISSPQAHYSTQSTHTRTAHDISQAVFVFKYAGITHSISACHSKHMHVPVHIHIQIHINIYVHRYTDTHIYTYTDTPRSRETERHTETERQRERQGTW